MDLPLTIGGAIVTSTLVVLFGVMRFFFNDNKALDVLRAQVESLTRQQIVNTEKIAAVEARYDEQRKEKHAVINKYAQSRILLSVIDRLAEQCTCGALSNVRELLDQALTETD